MIKRLLQHWVTDHAMQQPDSPAVISGDRQLTYEELEVRSNRLAHILKEQGCRRGDRICFLMPGTPDVVVTIIGILKADCVYVPLDEGSPVNRLAGIIEKSRPSSVIASGEKREQLADLLEQADPGADMLLGWMGDEEPPDVPNRQFLFEKVRSVPETTPAYANSSADPAHILFTSGSTGEPKGVVTTHFNDISFARWFKTCFDIQPGEHLSGHAPFHFDMSSMDLYGSLSSGAQLHMVPPGSNVIPGSIAEFIRDHQINQWLSVPSVLNYMTRFDVVKKNDFPSLKRVLWCGEVFPTPALKYWMERLPHVTFTNLYGPTETTGASSYYTLPRIPEDDHAEVPIGRACAGEQLHILDEDLNPVPTGQKGDLYISGEGVSLGYWDDVEQTEQVFLPDPFSGGNVRIYKTGDIARREKDGLHYFHGRADNQIKSRGYRIEPGEIEGAVNSLDLTGECSVFAIPANEFQGQTICCAYVPAGNTEIYDSLLKRKLRNLLPDYMIPQLWESFMVLPRNKNGKIDRQGLQEHFRNDKVAVNI